MRLFVSLLILALALRTARICSPKAALSLLFSFKAYPRFSAYVTSKAALIRFSEVLALETVEADIQVFAIHPEPSAHR